MKPLVFAHRGASGYAPENTLEAFDLAARMGAHGVELDVHICRNGELVVAHDETVERVSDGTGRDQARDRPAGPAGALDHGADR